MTKYIKSISEWGLILLFYAVLNYLCQNSFKKEPPEWFNILFHVFNTFRLLGAISEKQNQI